MDSINIKEKRKGIRIPLINTKGWLADDTTDLIDVSETGAFIASTETIHPDDRAMIHNITINLPQSLGKLTVPCEIVRVNWIATKERKKGYAIKWVDMPEAHKKILDAWLTYLRNHQIITVSKRIIEEFYGPRK